MSYPRAKTFQERMGFIDNDLKSPEHDSIMLALDEFLTDEVLIFLLNHSGIKKEFLNKYWDIGQIENMKYYLEKRSAYNKSDVKIPEKPYIARIDKKIWEYPIMNGKFMIGALDLALKYSTPHMYYVDGEIRVANEENYLMFEIKVKIPSLGELFRQLNVYREYTKCPIIVVSEDTECSRKIMEQGFPFIARYSIHPKKYWEKHFYLGSLEIEKDHYMHITDESRKARYELNLEQDNKK